MRKTRWRSCCRHCWPDTRDPDPVRDPRSCSRAAGQPGFPGVHRDDPGPGGQPAADSGGAGCHRPGENRFRQDRGFWSRAAGQARCAALSRSGAGVVPDPRTGGSGGQGNPQAGPYHSQYQGADPVRRHAVRPPAGLAGTRRPHHRRHAGAGGRTPAQRLAGAGPPHHPGAGRSRSHAGNGLCSRAGCHRRQGSQTASDPAVQCHLSRPDPAHRQTHAAAAGNGESGIHPRRGQHRPAFL